MNTRKRLDYLLEFLRSRGNRLTPQRVAILRAIVENDNHPSADDVYAAIRKEFPTTSLATVYKTITLLKEAGEILELGFGDDGSRYDGRRPKPHPHLICTKCGAIMDSDLADMDSLVQSLARSANFKVLSNRFDIFGLCAACQD